MRDSKRHLMKQVSMSEGGRERSRNAEVGWIEDYVRNGNPRIQG